MLAAQLALQRQQDLHIARTPYDSDTLKLKLKPEPSQIRLRRDVSKNETFWHDSDPWRIFSTSFRGLWAFPGALTYMYGIPTSLLVEPACETVTSPQSEVRRGFREWTAHLYSGGDSRELSDRPGGLL